MDPSSSLYRTIWRWHFYAALYVVPFILILSVTGGIYLFKPQIDRWQERAFHNLETRGAAPASVQLQAAMAAHPGATFHSYRLPERSGDAAMVHLGLPDGRTMRDVFVSPRGTVLASRDPDATITGTVARIHGSLLLGRAGDWLVELAASWAIVMIVTGLYLWWPRGRGLAGVAWPRLALGQRAFWRDIHAVTGFWVSAFALFLLLSGLPWAGVWGEAFRAVRAEMGWVNGAQDWKSGAGEHASHDHAAMMKNQDLGMPVVGLDEIVRKAQRERMAFPVLVMPPGAPQRHGPPAGMVWTVKSEAQNRPLVRSVTFDMETGRELARQGFSDKHPIDQAVNYGIAWHEGQLFGWVNQLVGLFTAIGLFTLAVSGLIMWWRRRPDNVLGAPPAMRNPARVRGVTAIILLLALLLPLLAASLVLLWLADKLILPRLAGIGRWLGLRPATA